MSNNFQVFCSVPTKINNIILNNNVTSSYYTTWKNLLISGLKIKSIYLENNFPKDFKNELLDFSNLLYKNLKFCEIMPRLRLENKIIENEINSSLLIYL